MALSTETKPAVTVIPKHDAGIDYQLFLDCVHCGLCTSACPTYVELGDENDSPRGRIYLMRAVTDGRIELTSDVRRHLDLCLDCRACESACPSGVQYGNLIEPFRIHLEKSGLASNRIGFFMRTLLFHITPSARRMRWALAPAKMMQWLKLDRLVEKTGVLRLLPRSLRQLHEMLPRLARHYGRLPEHLPAEGKRRARVALFLGCAGDAFFPQTNLATARVLQKNGCDVWIPRGQACCGALHFHSAKLTTAQDYARKNCGAFLPEFHKKHDDIDAIVVNAAGCGAMLKEYGHLFADGPAKEQANSIAAKTKDICEFLLELGPVKPQHPLPMRAVYHDACHLCHAQQIRQPPRELLQMIPQLELVPLSESEICCGAAGSYNLTQPEMADRLGRRKAEHVLATNADAVFAGNVGCLLQIGRYLREHKSNMTVAHPIDALDASYRNDKTFLTKK